MLTFLHRQHLLEDNWSSDEIDLAIEYGVRSIDNAEAQKLLGYSPPSGGIWFPFTNGWGQLRPNSRQYPNGKESPKYCSPKGRIDSYALWIPNGFTIKDVAGVTEGWKDAFIATIRGGKPIGAIAGVTHVPRVLPKGLGIPLVFDADGWKNAQVMQALIKGGLHLNSKIALIPEAAGDKAGFTEFFNAGYGQQDFDTLLTTAKSPRGLLIQWLDYLHGAPLPKHCDTLSKLYRKLWKLAWFIDRDCPELNSRIETFCKAHSQKYGAKLLNPQIRTLRIQALKPLWEQEKQQHLAQRKVATKRVASTSWQVTNCFDDVITFTRKGKIELPPAGRLAALMEQDWGDRLKYRLDFSNFYTYP
ncbi:MAG: hypothetical protein AAFW75_31820 [Cyanobacteria bacterium J06636_16]